MQTAGSTGISAMRMAVILVPERHSSRLQHLVACAARWMWEGGESGVHSQCVARGSGVHMVAGRGLGRRERGEAGGHLVHLTFRVGPWIKHSSSSSSSSRSTWQDTYHSSKIGAN